uniref:Uncharacterized protein n=1 Tax=Arundo donax TaxID=35708 RepID=A0A0A9EFY7_ARUDO
MQNGCSHSVSDSTGVWEYIIVVLTIKNSFLNRELKLNVGPYFQSSDGRL